MNQPINLDAIEAAINGYRLHPTIGFNCCSAHPVADAGAALVAEVRRLRAELEQERENYRAYRIGAEGAKQMLADRLAKEERQHGDTIDDRDRFHDMADKLAYAVAPEEIIGEHSSMNCPWENALDLITPMAEVDTLRQQIAAFTTLADRWQQMANHGDTAIGCFDGPAAATLDAEVGERGRTYRKAASDVRDVLATGRIPHDLMTDDELEAPAVQSRS